MAKRRKKRRRGVGEDDIVKVSSGLPSLVEILTHPLPTSVATGLVNGLVAHLGHKPVYPHTLFAMAAFLGLSKTALEFFTPPELKTKYSTPYYALFSVIGVAAGLAPFMKFKSSASAEAEAEDDTLAEEYA